MNRSMKWQHLATVSAVALGITAVSSMPARAFNDVDWTWTATISENIIKNGLIEFTLEPTGMTMLEDLQIHIGDVTATSTVNGINNNQPTDGGNGGPMEIDLGTLQFTGNYNNTTGNVTGVATAPELPNEMFLSGVVNPNDPFGVTMNFDLGSIMVEQDPGEASGSFDALTELPEVISIATAVGNNANVTADTAVQLHEAQLVVGDINVNSEEDITSLEGFNWSDVVNVTPAAISATSTVFDILNASVDSQATAVANNLSVELTGTGADRTFIGDVTQIAVADVSAMSEVYNVNLNSYTNLGMLDQPIVNSVATAVGNNKSITVSAPEVGPVTP